VVSNGAASAYQQHRSVLLEKGNDECPRKQLLTDLKEIINKWIVEGDQIVVIGDFNDDIRTGFVKSTFDALNLEELILRFKATRE
jgi:hypothetical protein